MTYDDWKTRDDTPRPDPNCCDKCGHPEYWCDCPCCVEPTLREVGVTDPAILSVPARGTCGHEPEVSK